MPLLQVCDICYSCAGLFPQQTLLNYFSPARNGSPKYMSFYCLLLSQQINWLIGWLTSLASLTVYTQSVLSSSSSSSSSSSLIHPSSPVGCRRWCWMNTLPPSLSDFYAACSLIQIVCDIVHLFLCLSWLLVPNTNVANASVGNLELSIRSTIHMPEPL